MLYSDMMKSVARLGIVVFGFLVMGGNMMWAENGQGLRQKEFANNITNNLGNTNNTKDTTDVNKSLREKCTSS